MREFLLEITITNVATCVTKVVLLRVDVTLLQNSEMLVFRERYRSMHLLFEI